MYISLQLALSDFQNIQMTYKTQCKMYWITLSLKILHISYDFVFNSFGIICNLHAFGPSLLLALPFVAGRQQCPLLTAFCLSLLFFFPPYFSPRTNFHSHRWWSSLRVCIDLTRLQGCKNTATFLTPKCGIFILPTTYVGQISPIHL